MNPIRILKNVIKVSGGVGCDKEKKEMRRLKRDYNKHLGFKWIGKGEAVKRTNPFLDIDSDQSVDEVDDVLQETLMSGGEDDSDDETTIGGAGSLADGTEDENIEQEDLDDVQTDIDFDNAFQGPRDNIADATALEELKAVYDEESNEIKKGVRKFEDRTVHLKDLQKLAYQRGHKQSSQPSNEAADSTSSSATVAATQDELDIYKKQNQKIHGAKIFKEKEKKTAPKGTYEVEAIVSYIPPTTSNQGAMFEIKWKDYGSSA